MGDMDRWNNRMRINARRVRDGWASMLGRYPWEAMACLTFDPARNPQVSAKLATVEALWWCGQAGKLARQDVGWAFAVESGRGGQSHVHALLVGCPSGFWRPLKAIWRARNGIIDVRPVDDAPGAAAYLCKTVGANGEIVLSDSLGRRPEHARGTAVHLSAVD